MKGKIISILIFTLLLIPVFSAAENGINWESPTKPVICGQCEADLEEPCCYSICSFDRQGDKLYYEIKYSDSPGSVISIGPYKSGEKINITHCWCCFYQTTNPFFLRVKAQDQYGHESEWERFDVTINNALTKSSYFQIFIFQISHFFETHPNLFPFLHRLL